MDSLPSWDCDYKVYDYFQIQYLLSDSKEDEDKVEEHRPEGGEVVCTNESQGGRNKFSGKT